MKHRRGVCPGHGEKKGKLGVGKGRKLTVGHFLKQMDRLIRLLSGHLFWRMRFYRVKQGTYWGPGGTLAVSYGPPAAVRNTKTLNEVLL